jgi:hypothetical protein
LNADCPDDFDDDDDDLAAERMCNFRIIQSHGCLHIMVAWGFGSHDYHSRNHEILNYWSCDDADDDRGGDHDDDLADDLADGLDADRDDERCGGMDSGYVCVRSH